MSHVLATPMHGPRRVGAEKLRARPDRGFLRSGLWALLFAWLALAEAGVSHAQTAPGTPIPNTAQATFVPPGGGVATVFSNTDTIITVGLRTPSVTELFHYAPGNPASFPTAVGPAMCSTSGNAGGPFVPSPAPTDLGGAPINLGAPVDLAAGGPFHQGEVVFVRIDDPDQNISAATVETLLVALTSTSTGDQEVLQLSETGANTGLFVGYLMTAAPPPVSGDCALSVTAGETFRADYTDAFDGTDSSSDAELVDPFGLVFDSATGGPIDGAQVTLLDDATGLPAAVLGDDGVSTFPSTITSGGTAADSGGSNYVFGPGQFRFPWVPAGTYRLGVVPPTGFAFPSTVADPVLQALPGAPFALGAGSRGAAFAVPIGPAFQVDVPLDGAGGGAGIALTKVASRASAGTGEFVQYRLTVNAPAFAVPDLALRDRLPPAFRYVHRSLTINGAQVPDPVVSRDGRTLNIAIGAVAAGAVLDVRYVVQIGPDAKPGLAHNRAIATGAGLASNDARAGVLVLSDFMTERSFVLGRVMIGACDSPVSAPHGGAANVRVFLEDGSQVVTDAEGRFHFAAVSADTHVVQLDLDTLPQGFAPLPCPGTRFAGSPFSQFVELQAGTLWRADFFLAPVASGRPRIAQRLSAESRGDTTAVEVRLTAENATIDGAAATVVLPAGARIVPGSLRLEGEGVRVEEVEGAATLRVQTLDAADTATLRFEVAGAAAGDELRSMVRAKGPGGVPVQTPVARLALCEACPPAFTDEGLELPEPPPPAAEPEAPLEPEDRFGTAWLETAAPGARWLYPEPGAIPKIPSVKIGIAVSPAHRIRLFRNGELVEPLNYDGRVQSAKRGTAVDRWRGVDLAEGPNRFTAEILDESGNPVERLEALVHFSGSPVRAELEPQASVLVADGRTAPVVALRMYDRWGAPVREGLTGPVTVAPPHQTREEQSAMHLRPLAGLEPLSPSWVVGENGIATIELAPTTIVGELRLSLGLATGRLQEFETWLEPGEREWVLVALGASTFGVNGFSGSDAVRKTNDLDEGSFTEGRFSFFAKGSVLGKWLLTAAYDTEAERTRLDERLFRTLDPDEHYTLYGDTTEQTSDAPTSDRLYLKVERSRFFALYGDYDTGLDQTELSRYTRNLHGVQTQYFGDKLRWNAFATESGEGFARDDIPGNGTSGLYRLSNAGIIANSERVAIETRDRFRASRVIQSRALSRHTDYDIDYTSGTLHFREAIPGRDSFFNPVFIVVDYEVEQADEAVTGGGRMAGRFFGGALEVGGTGLHEGRGDLSGQLFGADAKLELGDQTLRAEFAHSANELQTGKARGEGWLVAADHRSEKVDVTAYARQQDSGFGFGQQSQIDAAARRIGVDATVRVDDEWRVENSAFREQNLSTEDERTIGESVLVYETRGAGAHLGGRYVRDGASEQPLVPGNPDGEENVWQLLAGGHYDVWGDRVTLRGATEFGFGGSEDDHGDYEDRVLLGADWRVMNGLTVFGEQEFGLGERRTHDTRAGIRLQPWTGGSISSSFGHEAREWGPRTFANLGLSQHWNATQHWAFDFTVDRSQTLSGDDVVPFDAGAFPVSGSLTDDYTAVSLGAAFQRDATAFTSRIEQRFGDTEDQQNLLLGVLRDHERTSWSGRLEAFRTQTDAFGRTREDTAAARFGIAHRPLDPRFVLLEQIDLELETRDGQGFDFEARRVLHHLKLNHLWNRKTQLAYGWSSKWVTDTIDSRGYATFGNLGQLEVRRDLGDVWDVGLHLRGRHLLGESGDGLDFSTGVSVGRKLYHNVWMSVGYNFAGFHDEEFSRSDYTQAGFFFRVRVKVDQQSLADILGWPPRTREPAER